MALIELNLEKPALKRSETITGESGETTGERDTDAGSERDETGEMERIDVVAEEPDDEPAAPGGGRVRRTAGRMVRVVGVLGVAAVGALTLRKLRARRRSKRDAADPDR